MGRWLLLMLMVTHLSAHTAERPLSQKLSIGRFKSRAIWNPVDSGAPGPKVPAVILITGSGAHGPEEMMPGSVTVDGQDHSLFGEIARPLNEAGVATLALGKPGVEFFRGWDRNQFFYDLNLYSGLRWQNLLQNLADAIQFVKAQPGIDPQKVFVLGHSEGTQVAVDAAKADPTIKGLLLLGYAGQDLRSLLDWQLYRRLIDDFIEPDMDTDHDGFITKAEAAPWPQFVWNWSKGQSQVSIQEIETTLRKDPALIAAFEKYKSLPLYQDGIFDRGSLIIETASLAQDIYVFNGDLDENTPVQDSLDLQAAFKEKSKTNCEVMILPGLGHGFSAPRPPRAHRLLDSTLGPIDPALTKALFKLGIKMVGKTP